MKNRDFINFNPMKYRILQVAVLLITVIYISSCSSEKYQRGVQKPKYRKAGRYW